MITRPTSGPKAILEIAMKGADMGHLLLAGGGHAHMVTLQKLDEFVKRGHRVTVIGPSPYHYYSGMGPGMLSGFYSPGDIRFATRRIRIIAISSHCAPLYSRIT